MKLCVFLPPPPCLGECDEAAAGNIFLRLRWPPALRTGRLFPGGTWPSPDPTVRPSHRTGPLRGSAPWPGGPGQQNQTMTESTGLEICEDVKIKIKMVKCILSVVLKRFI